MIQTTNENFDLTLSCPHCNLNAESDDEMTTHLASTHPDETAATGMNIAAGILYRNDMPEAAKLCADTAIALLMDRPYTSQRV
jgi:hypothetical protein